MSFSLFLRRFWNNYGGSELWKGFWCRLLVLHDFPFFLILLYFSIALLQSVLSGNGTLHFFFFLFGLWWTSCLCHSLIPPSWKDSWLLQMGQWQKLNWVPWAREWILSKQRIVAETQTGTSKLWLTFWQHASLCQITSFLLERDCWSPSQSRLLLLLFFTQLSSRSWQNSGWLSLEGYAPD